MKYVELLHENHRLNQLPVSKQSAGYIDHSWSGERCKNCQHYITSNKCEIVHGYINKDGWCRYFEED